MNAPGACCHFSIFIDSFPYQRAKPAHGIVLFINLPGKGLTPGACMGDAGSIWRGSWQGPLKGVNLKPAEQQFNKAMNQVRVSVELLFGDIVNCFAFLDFKKKLNLLQSCWQIVRCACALKNAHSCLYQSSTSKFFWNISTPDPGLFQLGFWRQKTNAIKINSNSWPLHLTVFSYLLVCNSLLTRLQNVVSPISGSCQNEDSNEKLVCYCSIQNQTTVIPAILVNFEWFRWLFVYKFVQQTHQWFKEGLRCISNVWPCSTYIKNE